jgi:hypothetical protein
MVERPLVSAAKVQTSAAHEPHEAPHEAPHELRVTAQPCVWAVVLITSKTRSAWLAGLNDQ